MIGPGLHLCLPGALGPLPAAAAPLLTGVAVPALTRLVAGAGRTPVVGEWLETVRRRANGRTAAHAAGLEPGRWCLAAPVQLIPDRDTLVVRGPEALGLERSEAEALAAGLEAFEADRGVSVTILSPERWLLRVPDHWQVPELPPVEAIVDRRYGDVLPPRRQAADWIAWLNGLQMLLWSSPVSVAREASGLPRVSGLWVWGDGAVDIAGLSMPDRLYSDDPSVRGLASLAGAGAQPLMATAGELLTAVAAGPPEQTVVAMLPPLPAVRDPGGFTAWTLALEALDRDWLQPLAVALQRRGLPSLGLQAHARREWRCRRSDRLRVWRRRPSLADLCLFDAEGA